MMETSKNWYALYVKSRQEFTTKEELLKKGVETFLPHTRVLRQWKDRRKELDFPVFPGYLFVNILPTSDHFLSVLRTRGAVNLLALNPGKPTPVAPEEMQSLMLLMASGRNIDIYPQLKEGTPVRVKRGALAGAEGILGTKQGDHIFLVNIEILGRSVGVKLYSDDLENV
jgi:transcription antitermination factor NusG